MTMFKSAENLLTSLRDAIFKLPTNNSIIIGYEHLPLTSSGVVFSLRVPPNAKKAIIYPEDSGMPLSDTTNTATALYPPATTPLTSKILLGRYLVTPQHVSIPISTIVGSLVNSTITIFPNNPTSKSHPIFNTDKVTVTGNSVAAFNGADYVVTGTGNNTITITTTGVNGLTGTGGSLIYTPTLTNTVYTTSASRDGLPFYRGEPIVIEGYTNLTNFRVIGSGSVAIGLKVTYFS